MQEQLLERLRDRLGEQAPRTLRFRVGDWLKSSYKITVICRDFMLQGRAFGRPELVSLCQLDSAPTPALQTALRRRGFL